MSNRETPQINAGSMADIAFLLLIFFLVTTTLDSEIGIFKMLSDKSEPPKLEIKERNVLEISINPHDEIQIESAEIVGLENIKQLVMDFIDNGARTDQEGKTCDWCNGKKNLSSSDHPAKAIVSLKSSRSTSYGTYIATQNEINSAYRQLRNNLANSLYGKSFDDILKNYKKNKSDSKLKAKINIIKKKYPVLISEIEPVN